MIEAVKAHIPLRAEIEAAGVHLERDKGLCPFHQDKHPSLSVKGDRWKCWSCGEGGDVIDFTAKYHGLDTRGALRLLADRAGLKLEGQTQAQARAAQEVRREREERRRLTEDFRVWEQTEVDKISTVLRVYRHMRATRTDFTEAELVELAELQGEMDLLESRYEILCGTNDESKFGLYREMRNAG